MIRYIVDGHNLMNGVPQYEELLQRDYAVALKTLYHDLKTYAESKSVQIILAFDGNPPWEPPEDSERISLKFSGEARSADTVIIGDAEKHKGRQSIVVTGDRRILRAVAASGCRTLTPVKFTRLFSRKRKGERERPGSGDEKPGYLTPPQVRWWKTEMKKALAEKRRQKD
ncbi:MAG: NYN domain-containing protein [Candidatus Neomarinimicrobiota bacterium]